MNLRREKEHKKHKRHKKFFLLLLVSLLCFLCFLCSVPVLLAQSASIQGIVTRSGSRDSLSKATVELRTDDSNGPVLNSMTTEDDGRFVFQNVRPGRYRLTVKRGGYVRPPT